MAGAEQVREESVELGVSSEIEPKRFSDELEERKRGVGNQI